MNLRQIRYFVAVYEEGSFSKAAKRENCSQPGLSTQIRQLEETLSNSLFDRSVHGVVPTLAGQQFYRSAVAILKSVQNAEHEMEELSGEVSGFVNAGLIPSVVRGLLPPLLPKFVNDYPHIKISLAEAYSGTLTDWVLSGELDFAVVIDPPTHEGLEIETMSREKMVLISGRALKLTPWEPVRIKKMPPLKLVVPTRRHGLRENLDRFIQSGKIEVAQIMEMDAMQGSIEFIRNSDWATILPFTAVIYEVESKTLCFNPIIDPDFYSNFFLINQIRHPLSAAARIFVDALEQEVRAVAKSWESFVSSSPRR